MSGVAMRCAAANGGGPSRLQAARLVAAVAELGSLGDFWALAGSEAVGMLFA